MATETMQTAPGESSSMTAQPEMLVSAVLHLMSHYTAARTGTDGAKLAAVIERHLKVLADLPELAPVLRATCHQLSGQWAGLVAKTMQASEKRSLLQRLVVGSRAD